MRQKKMIKKLMLVVFLLVLSASVFCEPSIINLTVDTMDGKKTYKVADPPFWLEQRRFSVDGKWIVTEVRTCTNLNWANWDSKSTLESESTWTDWTKWERVAEMPAPFTMDNLDMQVIFLDTFKFHINAAEGVLNESTVLYVPMKNPTGVDFWWESRKYLTIQRKIYYVIKE